MSASTRTMLIIGVIAATVTPAAIAGDEKDALIDALRSEVTDLKQRVSHLETGTDENWLTERRAEEIRCLVEDVLADADTRASLLQDGMTAGWDKHFFLQSADGNWRLRLRGQLQIRYVFNNAMNQDQAAVAAPDSMYGFEVRRAKVKFDGHVVDPSWYYNVSLAVDHDTFGDGNFEVEDAFFRKSFDNGVTVWGGQYKVEFNREELTSSSAQQAVDRSLVNEFFNLDRSQGVMVQYTGDRFRLWGAYMDGAANRWGGFDLTAAPANAFTGRIDWLAAGNWKQFKDPQGWKGQDFGAMVGAAIHYQQSKYGMLNAGPGPFSTARTDRLAWTIDAGVEGDGWNVFAYVVGNHLSDNAIGSASADQIGIVVQGAYMLTDKWDVYGRYEWGDLDDNSSPSVISTTPGLSNISIITLGTNYYFAKHAAKWTTDIGFGLDPIPVSRGTGVGWRTDAGIPTPSDGQFVFRTQFQLLF